MSDLSEIIIEGEVTDEDLANGYTDFVINVDRNRWFGIKNEFIARGIGFVIKDEHLDSHGYLEMVVELAQGTMHYRYSREQKKTKYVNFKELNKS